MVRVRKKEVCDDCNELRRVEKRKANNAPVCDRCYKKKYVSKRKCSICENIKIIEKGKNGKDLCGSCNKLGYSPPKRKCSICYQLEVIRKIDGEKLICRKCYTPPIQTCSVCNKKRKVNAYVNNSPVCGTCYKGKVEKCAICCKMKEVYIRNQDSSTICKRCYNLPKKICSVCKKIKKINKIDGGNPVCIICYKAPKRNCNSCKKDKPTYGYNDNSFPLCYTCFIRFRRKTDVVFGLKSALRCRVNEALKTYLSGGKVKKSKDYGIDYIAIIKHLGPCPGKREEYHIDHIFPLSAFDFSDELQIKLAFSPENHQWLKKEDNLKKSAKYDKESFFVFLKKGDLYDTGK